MLSTGGTRYLPTRVRHLSPAEIIRSARDVFGSPRVGLAEDSPALKIALAALEVMPPLELAADTTALPAVPDELRRWIASLSGRIARALSESAPRLFSERATVEGFVDTYGRRIFREPLTPSLRAELLRLFEQTREHVPFTMSVAMFIGHLFADGRFLTRTELGVRHGGIHNTPLTHHEVASALSYFIWGTAPSDQLLDAAALGLLDDPRVLKGFTDVMLVDERAQRVMSVQDNVPETLLKLAFGDEGGEQIRLDEQAVATIAANARNPRVVTHAIVASPAFRVRRVS